jgi:hypothetical protein
MRAAFFGGFIAAALDLIYAFVAYGPLGVAPITILQSIGSGWLGGSAYAMGWSSAGLGLASHFLILCVASFFYVYLLSRSSYVTKHPWIAGAVYGLAIFVAMNFAVVPLSAAEASPPRGWLLLGSLGAHMFLVGIPIALTAHRLERR